MASYSFAMRWVLLFLFGAIAVACVKNEPVGYTPSYEPPEPEVRAAPARKRDAGSPGRDLPIGVPEDDDDGGIEAPMTPATQPPPPPPPEKRDAASWI